MAPISPTSSALSASPASPASSPLASATPLAEALPPLEIALGPGAKYWHLVLWVCLLGVVAVVLVGGACWFWVWVAHKYPPIKPLASGASAENYARFRAQFRESRPSWGTRLWRKVRKMIWDEDPEEIGLPEIRVGALDLDLQTQIQKLGQRIAEVEAAAGGGG